MTPLYYFVAYYSWRSATLAPIVSLYTAARANPARTVAIASATLALVAFFCPAAPVDLVLVLVAAIFGAAGPVGTARARRAEGGADAQV